MPGISLVLPPMIAAAVAGCPVSPAAPSSAAMPARAVRHVFQNGGDVPLALAWIDPQGRSVPLEVIPPRGFRSLRTTVGHRFALTDPSGECREVVTVDDVFTGTMVGTSRYRAAAVLPGWHVMVEPASDLRGVRAALAIVATMLAEAERALPPAALAVVKRTPIFLRENQGVRLAFHQDPGWLVAHGRTVELVDAVEIPDARTFAWNARGQPGSVLHELAHAYYFQLSGADRSAVEAAYRRAIAASRYVGVKRIDGAIVDAYARADAAEYFAELTEAYFSRNDYFPFTRSDLVGYDPEGAALIGRLWGVTAPQRGTPDHP